MVGGPLISTNDSTDDSILRTRDKRLIHKDSQISKIVGPEYVLWLPMEERGTAGCGVPVNKTDINTCFQCIFYKFTS